MASKAVVDAVEGVVGSSWTSGGGISLPVIGLNAPGPLPADGSPHIEIDYPVANKKWLTFGDPGNNQFRETGGFRIVINEKRGAGTERAQGWADELAALYQGKAFLGGNLQCDEAGVPIVNNGNATGSYFQFSFVVTYRFYSVG